MQNGTKIIGYFFFCVVWGTVGLSCDWGKDPAPPDVSDVVIQLNVHRFEQDLFTIQPSNIKKGWQKLKRKYPTFFPIYIERVLGLRPLEDTIQRDPQYRTPKAADQPWKDTLSDLSSQQRNLQLFLSNKYIKGLYDTCMQRYANFKPVRKELRQSFRYYRHYFPEASVPSVYTYVAEFTYGAFTADSILAIELDMFLGKDYKYYPSAGLPNYLIRRLARPYLAPTALQAWLRHTFPYSPDKRNLLSKMVYRGKILHCLNHLFPEEADTTLIGYRHKELEWCRQNEAIIWAFFIEHDLLYETDQTKYMKYVKEGPTTSGMPPQSPGNVGSWLGWRIVRQFVEQNPDISLQELMENDKFTGQYILQASNYQPENTFF